VRPIHEAEGSSVAVARFSDAAMSELMRAMRERAERHPENPGLIASWPGVPEARMPAACAELRRRGHAVREVSIGARHRRGWTVGPTMPTPAALARDDAVLVRERAEPKAVSVARAAVTEFATREGVPASVRTAMALAVSEACTNVVMHAYLDAKALGSLEVRARVERAVVVIEVADAGRGMIPRIDSPGLGLGLPLIAQMADSFEIVEPRDRAGVVLRMHFHLPGNPEIS
jgi:serine/threonine-protein kinase RsbW/stage II sporulation protein AB (anti-sigma F factor)